MKLFLPLSLLAFASPAYAQTSVAYKNGVDACELRNYPDCVRYLEQALATPLSEDERAQALELLTRARTFVAEIELGIGSTPARVTIDGTTSSLSPGESLLLPFGKHEVTVEARGFITESRSFVIQTEERLRWLLTPERVPTGRDIFARAPDQAPARAQQWGKVVGAALVATGALGYGLTWKLSRDHTHDGDRFRRDQRESESWRDSRYTPYGVALTATVLTSAGALTLLQATDGSIPWWASGLSGLAGVGLASWGIVDIARGSSCKGSNQPACSRDQERRDHGAAILMSAAPALMVPIYHLVLHALHKKRQRQALVPAVAWERGTLMVSASLQL